MTLTVFVQFDRLRVCGLVTEIDSEYVRVRNSWEVVWPDQFQPQQSPQQAAELLRKHIPAADGEPIRTVLCLTREDVILRHLEVPDVPEAELPDLVRFQAAARSTLPLDQLLLDFLPLPRRAGHEGRTVLSVTAAKSLVQSLTTILEQAGCRSVAATFSSIGIAECTAHGAEPASRMSDTLAITRDGSRAELVVLSGRQLLYAHSARLAADDESTATTALLAEVSRTLIAAQRLQPQLKISRAFLFDDIPDAASLTAQLAERIGAPVDVLTLSRIDDLEATPQQLATISGNAVPLVGLALGEGHREIAPFDFLHPRQPPVLPDYRKIRLAVGTAAALLLSVLVFGSFAGMKARLLSRIESLREEEQALDLKLKPGQTVLQSSKQVDDWLNGDVNQLKQMAAIRDLMEGTDRLYLSQYSFLSGQGDQRGTVQSFGNAKSPEDVQQFYQRLIDTKEYRIQPRQLTQSGRDDEYPHRFELHADLLTKPKVLPAAPPVAKK